MTKTSSTPSRRAVAQGATWSVPVVVAASIAPALAASTTCGATESQTGTRLTSYGDPRDATRSTVTAVMPKQVAEGCPVPGVDYTVETAMSQFMTDVLRGYSGRSGVLTVTVPTRRLGVDDFAALTMTDPVFGGSGPLTLRWVDTGNAFTMPGHIVSVRIDGSFVIEWDAAEGGGGSQYERPYPPGQGNLLGTIQVL